MGWGKPHHLCSCRAARLLLWGRWDGVGEGAMCLVAGEGDVQGEREMGTTETEVSWAPLGYNKSTCGVMMMVRVSRVRGWGSGDRVMVRRGYAWPVACNILLLWRWRRDGLEYIKGGRAHRRTDHSMHRASDCFSSLGRCRSCQMEIFLMPSVICLTTRI